MDEYKQRFEELYARGFIVDSTASFKIKLFVQKAEESVVIANNLSKPPAESTNQYWYAWAITVAYYAMLYAAKAAILKKYYEVKTHEAAEIALAHLLIPDELKKEDLELLGQAHKLFEEEYLEYFKDARTESSTARYQAKPSYTQRRMNEVLENARKFVAKISLMLD